MRGNLWSRAPANRARPEPNERLAGGADRRRRAGRNGSWAGPGAGRRRAGGARRHHRSQVSSGPRKVGSCRGTVKLPVDARGLQCLQCLQWSSVEIAVFSRNSPDPVRRSWRFPAERVGPPARCECRASRGHCSGHAGASRPRARAAGKRDRHARRGGAARTATASHTTRSYRRGPLPRVGQASAGRPAKAGDPRCQPVQSGRQRPFLTPPSRPRSAPSLLIQPPPADCRSDYLCDLRDYP